MHCIHAGTKLYVVLNFDPGTCHVRSANAAKHRRLPSLCLGCSMRLNTITNTVLQLVSDFPGLPADTYLGMQCADKGIRSESAATVSLLQ